MKNNVAQKPERKGGKIMEEDIAQKPDEVIISKPEIFSEVSLFNIHPETSESDLPDYMDNVGCRH